MKNLVDQFAGLVLNHKSVIGAVSLSSALILVGIFFWFNQWDIVSRWLILILAFSLVLLGTLLRLENRPAIFFLLGMVFLCVVALVLDGLIR